MSHIVDLRRCDTSNNKPHTRHSSTVGFSSISEDLLGATLDLNKELIRNPASTFYAKVKGESMSGAEIHDGDILVIDRLVETYDNCIAVCHIDGEFTLKRVKLENKYALLISEDNETRPLKVDEHSDVTIWGVVSYCIKKFI